MYSKDEVQRRRAHLELDRWLMENRVQVIHLLVEALENRPKKKRWSLRRWPAHKHRCTECKNEFVEVKPIYKIGAIVCCSYTCWIKAIAAVHEEEEEHNNAQ
jgi:hypothetical protein